jgi:glycosyltransferase involved in cell wall biosynthesis
MTVYNEASLIEGAVDDCVVQMEKLGLPYQVLIANDGSSDWTPELQNRLLLRKNVTVKNFYPNEGKGATLSKVFSLITTDLLVLTDADQEYHGSDIPAVLRPLLEDRADWVQGSRYDFGRGRPEQYLATYLVNRCINGWLFLLSGRYFRDCLCGLYAMKASLIRQVRLKEKRFSYTGELVWTLLRKKARIAQVPVSYTFRTYGSGKKIKWYETFTLIRALLYYKFRRENK